VLKRDTNGSSDLLSQQPSRYFPPIMLLLEYVMGLLGLGWCYSTLVLGLDKVACLGIK
jgi:hypothetical protein